MSTNISYLHIIIITKRKLVRANLLIRNRWYKHAFRRCWNPLLALLHSYTPCGGYHRLLRRTPEELEFGVFSFLRIICRWNPLSGRTWLYWEKCIRFDWVRILSQHFTLVRRSVCDWITLYRKETGRKHIVLGTSFNAGTTLRWTRKGAIISFSSPCRTTRGKSSFSVWTFARN